VRTSKIPQDRLFLQDRDIAINVARASFAGWHDLLVFTLLLTALAIIRLWFADLRWTTALWTALAASAAIGHGAGRLVAARLSFHAFDGLLAADALHPPTRRRYIAAWHGIGLAVLAALTLIARPSLLIASLPAYLVGVLGTGLLAGLRVPIHLTKKRRFGWAIRSWSHRPGTGVATGMILLVSLLPARMLGTNQLVALVGIESVLFALALTAVDFGIVRFMVISGHGPRRIIVHHGGGMAAFAAVAVPGCWIVLGSIAASIVAAASAAMLLFCVLRILAYRLHGKRFADFLVSILASLLMLTAYSAPVALPVVVLAMLWQLQRRGRAKTWLLA
jgi:hypothetical protein